MLIKKIVTVSITIALILSFLPAPAAAAYNVSVLINGERFAASSEPIALDSGVYVPLREFTLAVNPSAQVGWNANLGEVDVYSHGLSIRIPYGEEYITVNGHFIYISGGVFGIDGVTYISVTEYCMALGANAVSNRRQQSVSVVYTGVPAALPGGNYDSDDLYWLSRIISAEARGEPLAGQIAVGNVVLNRVAYKSYPNTIHGVIFDKVCGVQFSPISNGSIYDSPTERAVIAAKMVLDGTNTAGESLFFLNERTASSGWASRTRQYYTSIGNHNFYL
ncbi:MAG: cell wall hydrolase [Oscillospiraceae bacterium]|jgi:N-acetylmuramoyl-L-alanine amidase|nr:cell wall hydrolase [Oscillospiraceae bacterium]